MGPPFRTALPVPALSSSVLVLPTSRSSLSCTFQQRKIKNPKEEVLLSYLLMGSKDLLTRKL